MTENLPSIIAQGTKVSPAIAIMLDDKLFERTKQIASYLSKADGFVPGHLIGKPEACFAVVTRALTWKLDPFAVAQSTYSPAPGKVGFEGKLCQAIIENSGQIEGGVEYETYGDWSKVQGKFEIRESQKGTKYPVATYKDQDEVGLGVIARAQVKNEKKPREFRIDLRQAFPRNSTLWATDPLTQLKYRAARGLGNIAMPGIFMGVPVGDDIFQDNNIKDVTPTSSTQTAETASINEILQQQAKTEFNPETGEVIGEKSAPAAKDHLNASIDAAMAQQAAAEQENETEEEIFPLDLIPEGISRTGIELKRDAANTIKHLEKTDPAERKALLDKHDPGLLKALGDKGLGRSHGDKIRKLLEV